MNTLPEQPLPLREVHIPSPSWWPPAPGWWLLAAVIVVAICAIWMVLRIRGRRRAWRQRVLTELDQLDVLHSSDSEWAASLHALLRRVARRYAPESSQYGGEEWRNVLSRADVEPALLDTLMTLESRMYQPQAEFDRLAVHHAARQWLDAALRVRVESEGPVPHA